MHEKKKSAITIRIKRLQMHVFCELNYENSCLCEESIEFSSVVTADWVTEEPKGQSTRIDIIFIFNKNDNIRKREAQ